ncbi:hypothetical protein ACIG54_08715 [Streptomyces achromogenes]|uniref:Uncharacterized protein n=1 Tax=Streptomyces achromogenes TaxID=67255 RepID=A0ABZ1KWE2_STRAH|nr:hypothetical protein [Streptomyces achromogenes]MCZ0205665.1 hypothetical protein [Streptomyces sp. UMAF16]
MTTRPGRATGAAYRDGLGQGNSREPTHPAGGLPAARHRFAHDGTSTAYGAGPRDRPRAVTPQFPTQHRTARHHTEGHPHS